MTAYEVIAKFAPTQMDRLSTIFSYLAEHSYEARLQNGQLLRDATDFRYWLRELSEAAKVADPGQGAEGSQRAKIRPRSNGPSVTDGTFYHGGDPGRHLPTLRPRPPGGSRVRRADGRR